MGQRKLKIFSDLEVKIRLLIITIHRRTKCSADLDLDCRETEIDYGSGMKRLTFELDL